MATALSEKQKICHDEEIPTHLNGFPVISHSIHKACVTVAVKRWDHVVIATWWPDLKDTWMWGHYMHGATGEQQQSEYLSVAARNAQR